MELILKPTGKCNFKCKFCSAANMDIMHPSDNKVPEQIKEFIKKSKPSNVIVTGGEPLMVDPEYYYELHDISGVPISITSNLKNFYKDPDKWVDLFRNDWFGVATSFNYGDTRMWDSNTVYDENKFIEVVNLFRDKVGIPLHSFIGVIDYNNENTVIDHVLLAKKLNMIVKLNNAVAVGRQGVTYPRYKMYQHYLNIVDAGLGEYEWNCIDRNKAKCPKNINGLCDIAIRTCHIDSNGKLHVSICDETSAYGIEFDNNIDEIIEISNSNIPEIIDPSEYIKPECVYCELFRLCNGCKMNRIVSKDIPEYCNEMKKLEEKLINAGWLI